jgi:hypothetical protein
MLGMLLVVPILGVVAVSWRTVLSVMAASSAAAGASAPPAEPSPATEAPEPLRPEVEVLAPEAT